MRHLVKTLWLVIKRRDQRIDRRAGFSGPIHVADMHTVEWSFTRAQHQWPLFFQADVGGAIDEVACKPVSNSGQSSHAAWNHNHGMRGIRAAGYVRANII